MHCPAAGADERSAAVPAPEGVAGGRFYFFAVLRGRVLSNVGEGRHNAGGVTLLGSPTQGVSMTITSGAERNSCTRPIYKYTCAGEAPMPRGGAPGIWIWRDGELFSLAHGSQKWPAAVVTG